MFYSAIIVSSFLACSVISIYLIYKYISFDIINIELVLKTSFIYGLITFAIPTIILDRSPSSIAVMIWMIFGTFIMFYFELIFTKSFLKRTNSTNNFKSITKNFTYSLHRSFLIIFLWPFFIILIIYLTYNKKSEYRDIIE
jgi:hypothetical protein